MGHLINPISTRLAFSSFWVSSWTNFSNKDFSYNFMLDKGLGALLDWVFIHSWFAQSLTKNGIFLSHYRIIRRGLKFRVHCFLVYNSALLLKSSFVEINPNALGIETTELWSKKQLCKKPSRLIINNLQKNLNKLKSKEVFEKVESASFFGKNTNSTGFNNHNNTKRFSKRESSNNKEAVFLNRLKKVYISNIVNLLNSYFSSLFSSLLTTFWIKIKEKNTNKVFIKVGVRFLDNFNIINPQFLARFIARRITYGFQLQRVIKPLIKDLLLAVSKKKNKIIGFRIACSGRFDRKQIASYVWQKFGPVPLNRFSCNINYGFSTAFLKYGTCGIKVWVATEHKPIRTQTSSSLFRSNFLKNISSFFNKNSFESLNLNKISRIRWLITLFNSFSLFEKNNSDSFNIKILKKELLGFNVETFLRFQLLALSWLKYENKFFKKV